jgi:hypothetical protein
MTLYKSLKENNQSPYVNLDFTPYLPKNGKPGKWTPKVAYLNICVSGWHGCEDGDILEYLNTNIYKIETRGTVLHDGNKFAAQQIRLIRKCEDWNEVNARLFACDCAAHVLKIFEKNCPNDKRPRECIAVARKFAHGKATQEEMAAATHAADAASAAAAARAAAWDAAWGAAWAAAGAAASAAAWDAAWGAASAADAAWAAAWDAASAAAWGAEKKWQMERLLQYIRGKV